MPRQPSQLLKQRRICKFISNEIATDQSWKVFNRFFLTIPIMWSHLDRIMWSAIVTWSESRKSVLSDVYSNTELYCSNIKQISTIPRQDSQHEITMMMTPLGEMEQNKEQSKNISRTNKNEQINASSESLGILSFIKILNTKGFFIRNFSVSLENHVIILATFIECN